LWGFFGPPLAGLLWPGRAQPRQKETAMSPSTEPTPTGPQLRYLRALAAKTGTTFAYPATRSDASREIDRLRKRKSEPRTPSLETDGLEAEDLAYATAVHPSEISGFGSSATWRLAPPPTARSGPSREPDGERTEPVRVSVQEELRAAAAVATVSATRTVHDEPIRAPDADGVSRLGSYEVPDDAQGREIVGLARPDGSTLLLDLPVDSLRARLPMLVCSPTSRPTSRRRTPSSSATCISAMRREGAAAA
jgi:hypothetical protein